MTEPIDYKVTPHPRMAIADSSPSDKELYWQKRRAARKDLLALIERNYSASRMNGTKWREAMEELSDLGLQFRLRWVGVDKVSGWMGLWVPFPGATWFDSATVGPFETVSIEWLEIDPRHKWGRHGKVVEADQADEIERRLRAVGVAYDWEGGNIRVTGHVRREGCT